MTSISSSSLVSSLSAASTQKQNLFTKLDTNADSLVSKDEFVAGRPANVSADQAGSLYDKIDTSGTGALTEAQLKEGLQKNHPHGGGHHAKADDSDSSNPLSNLSSDIVALLLQIQQQSTSDSKTSDDLFSKIDTNGDGTISKDEFAAAKPQATASATPPPPPPPAQASDSSSDTTSSAYLLQLLQAIEAYASSTKNSYAATAATAQVSAITATTA